MTRRVIHLRRLFRFAWLLGLAASGCARVEPPASSATPAAHSHTPKHGGVAAELGEEEYHVEFTYGDPPGVLQAYIMDGELEGYVRIAAPSFSATARAGAQESSLTFIATANSATGETVGDSSLFEARADGLVAQPALKISVPALEVKGHRFAHLSVDLPAGKNVRPKNSP